MFTVAGRQKPLLLESLLISHRLTVTVTGTSDRGNEQGAPKAMHRLSSVFFHQGHRRDTKGT